MRRLLPATLVAGLRTLTAGPAVAHVQGITPLLACSVGSPNSGGNGADGKPADDANGGPVRGLIPRDVGNAPVTVGNGGFAAAAGHCP